jgi:hypothetical protein
VRLTDNNGAPLLMRADAVFLVKSHWGPSGPSVWEKENSDYPNCPTEIQYGSGAFMHAAYCRESVEDVCRMVGL